MALNLRDQIQLLQDEFACFKMEIISKTETQFLKVKCQIAQMMEEIYLQSNTIQAVKCSVSALQLQMNENGSGSGKYKQDFQTTLVSSQTRLGLVVRDEMDVSALRVSSSTLNGFTKEKEFKKETEVLTKQFINVSNNLNILNSQGKENGIQNCRREQSLHSRQKIYPCHPCQPRIKSCCWTCNSKERLAKHSRQKIYPCHPCQPRIKSCCWTCNSKERLAKQENKRTKKLFVKVNKLEKVLKKCLKFSNTFVDDVTQQLQDVNEKMDENSFDIEQCWKDMEDSRNKSKHIMLNGDFVNVEDEISRMDFELGAMWLQIEEQNQDHMKLKNMQCRETNQFEFTNKLMSERLQKLEKLRDNLCLILNAKFHELRTFPVQIAKGTKWILDPVEIQEDMLKSGRITTYISAKIQCLTAMKQYENMSLEELRHLDYEGLDEAPTSTLGLINFALKNTASVMPTVSEDGHILGGVFTVSSRRTHPSLL